MTALNESKKRPAESDPSTSPPPPTGPPRLPAPTSSSTSPSMMTVAAPAPLLAMATSLNAGNTANAANPAKKMKLDDAGVSVSVGLGSLAAVSLPPSAAVPAVPSVGIPAMKQIPAPTPHSQTLHAPPPQHQPQPQPASRAQTTATPLLSLADAAARQPPVSPSFGSGSPVRSPLPTSNGLAPGPPLRHAQAPASPIPALAPAQAKIQAHTAVIQPRASSPMQIDHQPVAPIPSQTHAATPSVPQVPAPSTVAPVPAHVPALASLISAPATPVLTVKPETAVPTAPIPAPTTTAIGSTPVAPALHEPNFSPSLSHSVAPPVSQPAQGASPLPAAIKQQHQPLLQQQHTNSLHPAPAHALPSTAPVAPAAPVVAAPTAAILPATTETPTVTTTTTTSMDIDTVPMDGHYAGDTSSSVAYPMGDNGVSSSSAASKAGLKSSASDRRKSVGPALRQQLRSAEFHVKQVQKMDAQGFFSKPVDPVALGIPDYFTVITHPMDISTILAKFREGSYDSIDEVDTDVRRIFQNCYRYNGLNNVVSQSAKEMEDWWGKQFPRITEERKGVNYKFDVPLVQEVSEPQPQQQLHRKSSKSSSSKRTLDVESARRIHREITNSKNFAANQIFLAPVDPVQVPGYYDVVHTPMDLGTMGEKLRQGHYQAFAQYEQDFKMVVHNCLAFNRPGDWAYSLGQQLDGVFIREVQRASGKSKSSSGSSRPSSHSNMKKASRPSVVPMGYMQRYEDDDSADSDSESADETAIDDQQISLLQKNLEVMSQQLTLLLDKRHKKKSKKKVKRDKMMTPRDLSPPYIPPVPVLHQPMPPQPPKPRPPPKQSRPAPKSRPSAQNKRPSTTAPKKVAKPPVVEQEPELTFEQKKELSEKINLLDQDGLGKVVEIIQTSMPDLGTDEEIELDVEKIDKRTLWRLFEFVVLRQKKEKPKSKPKRLDSSSESGTDSSSDDSESASD